MKYESSRCVFCVTDVALFACVFQSIIMYEYLPSLLGDTLPAYSGYKPDVYPGISHIFQSAAFRRVPIFIIYSVSVVVGHWLGHKTPLEFLLQIEARNRYLHSTDWHWIMNFNHTKLLIHILPKTKLFLWSRDKSYVTTFEPTSIFSLLCLWLASLFLTKSAWFFGPIVCHFWRGWKDQVGS